MDNIQVPFHNLLGIPGNIREEIDEAAMSVIHSGHYLFGKETAKFEAEFAAFTRTRHCVSLDNGTNALEIALRALGIKPGDEVITVPNAGGYSTIAILAVGAVPVYADVNYETMNMDVSSFKSLITLNTRAVIVTHLYGRPAEIEIIAVIAKVAHIAVIEDCSHAHGATIDGKMVGSFGDISCFSFYPTKIIGALGDAGAIVTWSPVIAEKARTLRQYGWNKLSKYVINYPGGMNSRMDEIQAAALRVKLKYFDEIRQMRDRIACIYNTSFRNKPGIKIPSNGDPNHYTPYVYVVRVCEQCRPVFLGQLAKDGIETSIHYPVLDYEYNPLRERWTGRTPVAHSVCQEVVSLPLYPGMGLPFIQAVTKSVIKALNLINSLE